MRFAFIQRHKPTLLILLGLICYSALIAYATPPGNPYTVGETLDPSCTPGASNCYVTVLPDQTGNNGKFLTTNGTTMSWITGNTPSPITIGSSGTTLYSSGLSGTEEGDTGTGNNIFLGVNTGSGASSASNSVFLGQQAGLNATNASNSNFFGPSAGGDATNADSSNFFGFDTGNSATNASFSNFLGNNAGALAINASNSNFFGSLTGYQAQNAQYSTLIGFKVGFNSDISNFGIGSNNIIIGTNISLPDTTTNAVNIGGILFGTGTYATITGDPSTTPVSGGRIGIGTATPSVALDVVGQVKISDAIVDTSNTSSINTNDRLLDDENGTHAILWNTSNSSLRYNGNTMFDWKNLRMPSLGGNGAGIVGVDDSGYLSWQPASSGGIPSLTATQIAFGDGSGVMTSSGDFTYDSTGKAFDISFSTGSVLRANNITGDFWIGDVANIGNGNALYLQDIASKAYYDNTNHTGKFGINTSTPAEALDVVGGALINGNTNANSIILKTIGNTELGDVDNNTYLTLEGNDNSDKAYLFTQNGFGINTNNPENLLHLVGASSTPSLRLGSSIIANYYWDIGRENATTGDFVFINNSGGSDAERMRITTDGKVGIGTTSPIVALDVVGDTRINIFDNFSIEGNNAQFRFFGSSSGNKAYFVNGDTDDFMLGVGTQDPQFILHVGNSSISGIVARFQNSTGTCDINPTTTSLSCSSDRTLKKDITPLSDDILSQLTTLTPVTYHWNSEEDTVVPHVGFIAQDVESVFPSLVATDPSTGLKSLNYIGLIPYTIKAVGEINLRIASLPSFDDPTLAEKVKTFLTGIADGIATIGKVQTDEICIKSTCITEERLQRLIQLEQGQQTGGGNQTPPPTGDTPQDPPPTTDDTTPQETPPVDTSSDTPPPAPDSSVDSNSTL